MRERQGGRERKIETQTGLEERERERKIVAQTLVGGSRERDIVG